MQLPGLFGHVLDDNIFLGYFLRVLAILLSALFRIFLIHKGLKLKILYFCLLWLALGSRAFFVSTSYQLRLVSQLLDIFFDHHSFQTFGETLVPLVHEY